METQLLMHLTIYGTSSLLGGNYAKRSITEHHYNESALSELKITYEYYKVHRGWSNWHCPRNEFTDMVTCELDLNDELQPPNFRSLNGCQGILEGMGRHGFINIKRFWVFDRSVGWLEWWWERSPRVKLHWKPFYTRLWSF